eukprot:m.79064 g.79064  ORF g.79064 m.79064 type:complete len:59 (+) comp12700_c0_seq3:219-395(+)
MAFAGVPEHMKHTLFERKSSRSVAENEIDDLMHPLDEVPKRQQHRATCIGSFMYLLML